MNELIEIEYKRLIPLNIYNLLLEDYKYLILNQYTQTNYYFTHPLFFKKKYMLRIREKNNQYELTLKRPYLNHRLETNVALSKEEAYQFFNHKDIDNEIIDILKDNHIDIKDLIQQFSLTTHRTDIQLDYGILSLDHSLYNGKEDYEIEYEVNDAKKGYEHFIEILNQYNLTYTHNCKSKIQRVLETI